tara:strand:- start:1250 stop:2794 length:1545 start_codon:yes stop_codon:yes gene_type:complete
MEKYLICNLIIMFIRFFYIIPFILCLNAAEITYSQVQIISNNFIKNKIQNNSLYQIKSINSINTKDDYVGIYIVHLNPVGFIIISGDDRAMPVLGYSFNNYIELNNLPVQLSPILDSYIEGIEYIVDNNIIIDQTNSQLLNYYLNENNISRDDSRNVIPLITANWSQGGGWNDFCPNNSVVGCVAVAMGQVMYYWGHPNQGDGYSQYYDPDHGIIAVNFEDYNYNYNNMFDDYPTEDSQLLLYHSGVAVHMNYSPWSSGASVCWEGPSAQNALDENFGYNDMITCEVKINYTDEEWKILIEDQLDRGWPIVYRGYSDDAGHAWNIDGYEDDYYHCNWGWGGSSNGYFYFDNLNAGGYNFINNQAALLNIIPDNLTEPFALYEFIVDDLSVQFIDLSEMINEDQIVHWEWDFGTGDFSYESSPQYIYSDYGSYDVTLRVMNNYGLYSSLHLETITLVDLFGDLNGDSFINVIDIVQLVDYILDNVIDQNLGLYDLNFDFQVNILDVILLVQIIIS